MEKENVQPTSDVVGQMARWQKQIADGDLHCQIRDLEDRNEELEIQLVRLQHKYKLALELAEQEKFVLQKKVEWAECRLIHSNVDNVLPEAPSECSSVEEEQQQQQKKLEGIEAWLAYDVPPEAASECSSFNQEKVDVWLAHDARPSPANQEKEQRPELLHVLLQSE